MARSRYRYELLAIVSAGVFLQNLTQGALSPFLPLIIRDYQISNTEAGIFLSAFYLAFAVVQIPLGVIADLVSPRKILFSGLVVLILGGILFHLVPFFPVAVAARAVMGLGAGCLFVPGLKLIAERFQPAERGRAIGTYNSTAQSGLFVSIFGLPLLMNLIGTDWRTVHLLATIPAPILALVVLVGTRESGHPRRNWPDGAVGGQAVEVIRNRRVWPLLAFTFVHFGSFFSLASWAPAILGAYGHSLEVSAFVGAMLPLASIFAMTLGGILADKVPNRRLILILTSPLYTLAIYLFLTALPTKDLVLLSVTLFAIGLFIYVGTVMFSWLFDLYPFDQAGKAAGLLNSMIFFGSFVYPIVMGYVLDLTKSFQIMIIVLMVAQSLAFLSALLAPRRPSTQGLSHLEDEAVGGEA